MKFTIDEAIHKMRKEQAKFKREAEKHNNLSNRQRELYKASSRYGIIAEWLIDYKNIVEQNKNGSNC